MFSIRPYAIVYIYYWDSPLRPFLYSCIDLYCFPNFILYIVFYSSFLTKYIKVSMQCNWYNTMYIINASKIPSNNDQVLVKHDVRMKYNSRQSKRDVSLKTRIIERIFMYLESKHHQHLRSVRIVMQMLWNAIKSVISLTGQGNIKAILTTANLHQRRRWLSDWQAGPNAPGHHATAAETVDMSQWYTMF